MPNGAGGGGGGGIVGVGNTFTGPAEALEIIGDHCYAYSGNITDAGTSGPNTTMFNFKTGNFYVVGLFRWDTNNESPIVVDVRIKFNGAIIYDCEWNSSPTHGLSVNPLDVVIPPYTQVLMEFGASSSCEAAAQLTGRIYRG